MTPQELQTYLHTHIPITKALGEGVELATYEKVILSAPFANNINHKKTVFGGSLHGVATLASWCLLRLHVKEEEIVIAHSEVFYQAPVMEDFKAGCSMRDTVLWERFMKTLQARGKGRIALAATINNQKGLAVGFQGTFVALKS